MKGKMKRIVALLLSLMMVMSLTACGTKNKKDEKASTTDTTEASTEASTTDTASTAVAADSPYAKGGFDLEKKENVILYVLGDAPADMQKVLDEANSKYFVPNLNTKLEIKFLNWSDYKTKYSLVLAGGEDVDLIYTAAWCFYNQEVSSGAFKELTTDWLQKYMPYSYKEQPTESWDQISINGKIYAVPKSKASFNSYSITEARTDLIEKYKLTEPTSWDNLKAYLYGLADIKDETGVTPLKATANRNQLLATFNQTKNLEAVAIGFDFYYDNKGSEAAPAADDIFYLYTSDLYLDYCKQMAEMAAKGVWTSDAINDTSDSQAYFENGTSGTFVWNSSVYQAGKNLEKANLGKYAVYDVTPDALRRRGSYADDAIAIATNSKKQERAALVLDYIKSDVNLNHLLLGGIEGTHYKLESDGTRTTLEGAANYQWNSWAWALNRYDEPSEAGRDEREVTMDNAIAAKEYRPQTAGFTFDPTNVTSEYTVLNSVRDEYITSFSLGVFGNDTEKKFNEFKKKLESAGLDKVLTELKTQYEAYKTAKGF